MNNGSKLFNANFLILWLSQFVSQFGSQAFAVAMLFWLKHSTGSATLMGTLLMVSMIPSVLLGPLGGVFADRYGRKKIIVLCDLISGAAVVVFALLFFVIPEAKDTILVSMFSVSVIVSIIKAFFTPAVMAYIPEIVPTDKIPAANSLAQSSTQLAMLVGLGLGGVLFRLLGAPMLFLVDGMSYLGAAIAQLFMHSPVAAVQEKEPKSFQQSWQQIKKEIWDGFVYIWNNVGMRTTFLLAGALNFFFAPILVILPFYVEDLLKVKSDWYGYLFAAYGAGSVIGFLGGGVVKVPPARRGQLILVFFIILSVATFLLGLVSTPWTAFSIILVSGMLTGYINLNIINQLQLTTTDLRGRIFGNLTTFTAGIMPISLGLSGLIIDALHKKVEFIFFISGICMACICIVVFFIKQFNDFFAQEPEPPEEEILILEEEEELKYLV